MKKLLLASLFLGGGYILIKKLLPKFNFKEFKLEKKDYEAKRSVGLGSLREGRVVESATQPKQKNTLPFSVRTMAGEGNDSSWDLEPNRDEKQDDPKLIINGVVL